jgi:Ca2+-transporting ATPase
MQRKPRKPSESVFSKDVKVYLSTVPIFMAVLLLIAFFSHLPWQSNFQLLEARTQLLTAMIVMELAVAISCRSLKYPVFKVGPFKNRLLWIAVLSSFALQLLVLYTPGLQTLFDVHSPELIDWAIAGLFAGAVFTALEVGKYVATHRRS